MKNIITTIVIVAAFLGILVWVARSGTLNSPQANVGQASTLVASEQSYNFGDVSMAAGNVTHTFTIKNSGSAPVVVRKLSTSCMCTTALLINGGKRVGPFGMPGHSAIPTINETIAPGQEATVEAVFDPAAHGPAGVGAISREVYLEDSTGAVLSLGLTANVTP